MSSRSLDAARPDTPGLSVFGGPLTAADAEAVLGVRRHEVVTSPTELTERSLVGRARRGGYSLLETLRAFAAAELDCAGRPDEGAARHSAHFLRWVEGADEGRLDEGVTWWDRAWRAANGDVFDVPPRWFGPWGAASAVGSFGWHGAGEAELDQDSLVAEQRLERVLLLAGATRSAFVAGVARSSAAAQRPGPDELGGGRGDDLSDLGRRFVAGDVDALNELYACFAGPVMTVAMSRLAHESSAQEVVQDVFALASRATPTTASPTGPDGSVSTWPTSPARSSSSTAPTT